MRTAVSAACRERLGGGAAEPPVLGWAREGRHPGVHLQHPVPAPGPALLSAHLKLPVVPPEILPVTEEVGVAVLVLQRVVD